MKRTIIFAGLLAVFTAPAHTATKCVALDASSTTCTYSTMDYAINRLDWTATCTTGGVSRQIKGIGVCTDTPALTGAVSDTITVAANETNKYCWCKMQSPAVSSWVKANERVGLVLCANNCGQWCANDIGGNSAFRTAMFGSIQ